MPGLPLAARGLARGARQQGPSRGGLLAALPALLRRGAGGLAHRNGGAPRFCARGLLNSYDTSPYSYGLWRYGWRVFRAAPAAAHNRGAPPWTLHRFISKVRTVSYQVRYVDSEYLLAALTAGSVPA